MAREIFGKYELIGKLAVGGMAEIFLARQTGPKGFKKNLAIKRVLPHLTENQDFITMFLDEARLVARFNHPNLTSIFELGRVKNQYFMAMEYIHGLSLSQLLKVCHQKKERLPFAFSAKIVSLACDGLAYAHDFKKPDGTALNLIHRDVSPQNIMLSYEGAVKVMDFGIAKASGNLYQTRTATLKGKASYMSPEQIFKKGPVDLRSDIFSLGVVLYEFIAGRRPFVGDTELETMAAIVHTKPPSLRELDPRIPAELIAIIEKALTKDRKKRFQSARDMSVALDRFLQANKAPVDSHVLGAYLKRMVPPEESKRARMLAGEKDFTPTEAVIRTQPLTKTHLHVVGAGFFGLLLGVGILAAFLFFGNSDWARGDTGPDAETSVKTVASPVVPKPEPEKKPTVTKAPTADQQPSPTQPVPKPEPLPPEPVAASKKKVRPKKVRTRPGKKIASAHSSRVRTGSLIIFSEPWTEIFVDGASFGSSPMDGPIDLSAGEHKLKLVNASLGIKHQQRVRIQKGKKFTLRKKFGKGLLRVYVKPFGTVYVNGEKKGQTPLEEDITLYEGTHRLRARCQKTGKEESRIIKMKTGETKTIKMDLR